MKAVSPVRGGPRTSALALLAVLALLAAVAARAGTSCEKSAGNPARGKSVYQVCMACHSLDEDDVGPRHRGVVGRAAASVPGYAYSPALKSSHIVWDCETLDRWLAGPQGLVPGVKMFFSMSNTQDRADVIAYLAEQR
jgi:cytochrome c